MHYPQLWESGKKVPTNVSFPQLRNKDSKWEPERSGTENIKGNDHATIQGWFWKFWAAECKKKKNLQFHLVCSQTPNGINESFPVCPKCLFHKKIKGCGCFLLGCCCFFIQNKNLILKCCYFLQKKVNPKLDTIRLLLYKISDNDNYNFVEIRSATLLALGIGLF